MEDLDPRSLTEKLKDQVWRLNNLYWITDKQGKRVKFALNWAQQQLMRDMSFLNLVLKARQLGFTTFIDLYLLDCAVFYPDTRAGIIAHTRDDAEAIFRDKVKFAYDHLPDTIRSAVSVVSDNKTTLELSNNSLIRVGTSLRGGTLQYLHISEFGKICAKFPEKAREIVTGALNTIEQGQMAFIESTAEGQEGRFYDMCEEAQARARMGTKLTALDWKFHFYPWWKEPTYTMDPEGVLFTPSMEKYFKGLEAHGITLSPGQRAWYVKKAQDQKEDMKREYPSTPAEAFEASVEGAYYAEQMARAESEGRITNVSWEPRVEVETWWDLGMDDTTAIWFVQRVNSEVRFIDFLEASGEALTYYAKELRAKPYVYSRHALPHDVEVRELSSGVSRKETLEDLGVRPIDVAPKLPVDDGIDALRNLLARAWFDKTKCAAGIKALKNYRKDWDENRGVWLPRPRHDWASHPADAARTGATAREPLGKGPTTLAMPKFGAV